MTETQAIEVHHVLNAIDKFLELQRLLEGLTESELDLLKRSLKYCKEQKGEVSYD